MSESVVGWLALEGTKVLAVRLEGVQAIWEPIGLNESTAERIQAACDDVWQDIGGNCRPACLEVLDLALEMVALDLDLEVVRA